MAEDRLVRGYAEGLYAIAGAEGDPTRVEDELFAFAKAVESSPELREALTDPALPTERKRAVITEVLGDRAAPVTTHILELIVDQSHARQLGKIVQAFVGIAAERRSHVVAEVRTAVPLADERRVKLAAALSSATGRQVEVRVVVDPSVIGGAVAQVGDEVTDGTVRTRLLEAQELLRSK
jgi:F-type H+-transporting ATPase subunit delta